MKLLLPLVTQVYAIYMGCHLPWHTKTSKLLMSSLMRTSSLKLQIQGFLAYSKELKKQVLHLEWQWTMCSGIQSIFCFSLFLSLFVTRHETCILWWNVQCKPKNYTCWIQICPWLDGLSNLVRLFYIKCRCLQAKPPNGKLEQSDEGDIRAWQFFFFFFFDLSSPAKNYRHNISCFIRWKHILQFHSLSFQCLCFLF